jgi:hypothetical protein
MIDTKRQGTTKTLDISIDGTNLNNKMRVEL